MSKRSLLQIVVGCAFTLLSINTFAGTKAAPNFTARDANGKIVTLKELTASGPVLIDFWATWCVPCIQESKHVVKIYEKYSKKGFKVVAISEDGVKETAKVKQFAKAQKWPFIIIVDNNKELMKKFGATEVPAIYLIGKDNQIHAAHTGYLPGDEKKLEAEVQSLVE